MFGTFRNRILIRAEGAQMISKDTWEEALLEFGHDSLHQWTLLGFLMREVDIVTFLLAQIAVLVHIRRVHRIRPILAICIKPQDL